MSRSMSDEEWKEEMFMMDLKRHGIFLPSISKEEAMEHFKKSIDEAEAKKRNKKESIKFIEF